MRPRRFGSRWREAVAALAVAGAAWMVLASCGSSAQGVVPLQYSGNTMGTTYNVTIVQPSSDVVLEHVFKHTEAILDRINGRMSTYDSDSELSRFNQDRSDQWIPISAELYAVMREALRISRLTDGAFDVSVGPIVDLWGFGPSRLGGALPSDAAIQSRLAMVGYEHLELQVQPPAMRKTLPDLSVDLSAIAKGYAVDQIAEYFDSLSFDHYLIEVGGEMRAKGHNPMGQPWNVAIERPVPTTRAVHQVVHLENHGVATSGNYRNFFERDGQRYSHTINPKTGRPVTHTLASVTVIADSSMKADALATAFLVLGAERGAELAQQEQVASLFISFDEDGFHEVATPRMQRYLHMPRAAEPAGASQL